MVLDAILVRRPQVVLVDEFGHSNLEGSNNPKCYLDGMDLLDAQVEVLLTMNVQHVESRMTFRESTNFCGMLHLRMFTL